MSALSKKSVALGAVALSASLVLAGCGSTETVTGTGGDPTNEAPSSLVIGSQGFAESEILAQLYGQVLEANGFEIEYNPGIGSRETFIPGLQDGSIDLIPDYSGNLLYGADPEATATSSEDVEAALPAAVEGLGLEVLDAAPAEDADALVVTPCALTGASAPALRCGLRAPSGVVA